MSELSPQEAKSGNELLTLMGNVLASWQGVEHVVADLYLLFFRPSRADAASVAFYAVRTFDMKLGVVNALISFFCSEEQKASWNDLLRRIRKRSGSRNAVAHGLVCRHGPIGRSEFVVGESIYNIAEFPDDVTTRNGFYTQKELKEMCVSFLTLTREVDAFRQQLANDAALRATLDAPSSRVLQHEAAFPLKAQMPTQP
ncbi:hypothetical protein ACSHT2_07250 [Bradyrhizobium sp. PUT101]|uniref:hypothetical protein n=1 Tax=Bradyrhizobium sp. PUT101 TaxID=3447427 RepID=UPI003F868981